MNHKKQTFVNIFNLADKLVQSKHPAVEDINAYVSALRSSVEWLQELMSVLGVHVAHLRNYESVGSSSPHRNSNIQIK